MESFKGRKIDVSKKVRIYRNLNRKGKIYSIKQDNLVVAHTEDFIIKSVSFIINRAGKNRAIQTKTRNVHAFLEGYLTDFNSIELQFCYNLNYNPFSEKGFFIQPDFDLVSCNIAYKTKSDSNIKIQL